MSIALNYIWMLPVTIGIFGVYHFAIKDFGAPDPTTRLKAEE